MPTVTPCPDCEKKIKVPDGAEGKKLRCPHCKAMLLITEDGLESVAASTAVVAKPSRRRPDDEDDRPARRRSRDDDDEDDDRPARRRSRDDDEDEEDDRPRKKKKRRAGGLAAVPMWAWLAGGGGLLVILVGVLLLILLGGGSKFKDVKEGMTAKEVEELLGKPTDGDTRFSAVWYHPPVDPSDKMNFEKLQNVEEQLVVHFQNGKVRSVHLITREEMEKAIGGGMPGFR